MKYYKGFRQSWFDKCIQPFILLGSYFSKRTGGLAMRLILCQYQTVAPNIQGLYRVFTLIHTLVKPPFWWMPLERRDIKRLNVAHAGFGTEFSQKIIRI